MVVIAVLLSAMTSSHVATSRSHNGRDSYPIDHADKFDERLRRALNNARLPENLSAFQQGWRSARDHAADEIDFPTLQSRLKRAKSAVTGDLETYLEEFRRVAEAAGTNVHAAPDAAAANRIILEIARRHDVSLIAKSKSMVSEEIGSDMSTALGRDVSREDIAVQVSTARDEIRDAFFAAGMGITGANALIAESGTVMMVTNEGNGRLCASVPPVHVVLAGIEKLIPTFDDAVTQLRLLARSGTAQRITSYTTFITGPTPGHDIHIVLVDNGRRTMAAMPEFTEALHCIRCAACANVCPPYREVGGHAFGYIYTGAIGLVVTGFHHGLE